MNELQTLINKLQDEYDHLIRYAFQCEESGKWGRAEDLFEQSEIVRAKLLKLKGEAVK